MRRNMFDHGDQKKIAEISGICEPELCRCFGKTTTESKAEKIVQSAKNLGYELTYEPVKTIVKFNLDSVRKIK